MPDVDVASVTAQFEAAKAALSFILSAPKSSKAQVFVTYRDGVLTFRRGKTEATLPAVGSWPGKAAFYDDGLLRKLGHMRADNDSIVIRVSGHRLVIGECVLPCSWDDR